MAQRLAVTDFGADPALISSPAEARLLVATGNASDGTQLQNVLQEHFAQVKVSIQAEQGAADFAAQKPDVLVLAFESIALAQQYYLALYSVAGAVQQHPHRTVLLCNKAELPLAFDLCKQQHFDDYVLYWPLAYDGLRLPMSIWLACREMTGQRTDVLSRAELSAHAKHLGELEQTLQHEFSAGEHHVAAAQSSLLHLEHELARTSDEYSRRLAERGAGSALGHEIARLKNHQIGQARMAREQGLEPMKTWTRDFKDRVEPLLQGARALTDSVLRKRAQLLIVDDDATTRELLGRALQNGNYELLYAEDGIAALRRLRHAQPDLILMDVRMPELDGLSLTRQLKASSRWMSIPIIMMTADSRRETVTASLAAGAADFVVKPFTRESLRSKLDRVLAR